MVKRRRKKANLFVIKSNVSKAALKKALGSAASVEQIKAGRGDLGSKGHWSWSAGITCAGSRMPSGGARRR